MAQLKYLNMYSLTKMGLITFSVLCWLKASSHSVLIPLEILVRHIKYILMEVMAQQQSFQLLQAHESDWICNYSHPSCMRPKQPQYY